MAETDSTDNDKDPSTDVSASELPAQSETVRTRISPWVQTPAQAGDPFRATGWRHDQADHDDENMWSIPWANLMVVLFAIVFMLIGLQGKTNDITATDNTETKQRSPTINANLTVAERSARIVNESQPSSTRVAILHETAVIANKVLVARIENAIATSKNDQISVTTINERSIRLSLATDMLFHANSAELTQQARVILEQLSRPLRDMQHHLYIIGHTDDQPVDSETYTDNWALSLAHASAVTRFLIDRGKLEATRFRVMGRAQFEPLTSNLIASSRARNRRVEIIITLDAYPPAERRS